MLRTRDVYPWPEFFPSRIPDPGSKRFPDPGPASKNLSVLTQKLFLRNMILIFNGSRIQGSKMHRVPDLQHCSRGNRCWATEMRIKLRDPPHNTARETETGNGNRKWKPETETGNGNRKRKPTCQVPAAWGPPPVGSRSSRAHHHRSPCHTCPKQQQN